MEDIIDIIVTETTNLIEITSQPTDEIIDVNIIDNREDVTLNVTPTLVEININSLTGNFGILWGEIAGTLSNQTDLQNALNLKADLVDGKVPSSQLPSYVDDVVEVANYAALPVTGEVGKIYITLDTNYIYRWTGSTYVEIKDSSAVWGAITGTLSNQTDLQNALNAKANDNAVVHLAGAETITGAKTFSSAVIAPNFVLSGGTGNTGLYYGHTDRVVLANYTTGGIDFEVNGGSIVATLFPSGNYGLGITLDAGYKLDVNGTARISGALSGTSASFSSSVTASSIIKSGGTSSQFLKADGSVDSSTYLTTGTAASTYLPLTGGTLTGGLNGTFGNFSSYVNAQTIDISNSTASNALRITHTNGSYHAVSIVATGNSALYASGNVTVVGAITSTGVISAQSGLANGIGQSFALPTTSGTLALTSQLSSYLPLSGGTLTGALSGTSATFSGNVISSGIIGANAGYFRIANNAGSVPYGYFLTTSQWTGVGTDNTPTIATETGYGFRIYTNGGSTNGLTIASTGAATFSSSVTTGGSIASGVGLSVANGTNARKFELGYSTGAGYNFFQVYDGTSFQPMMINNTMYFNSSGNVGIGTTAPTVAVGMGLVINGGATSPRIALKNNASGDASTDGFQLVLTTENEAVLENRENASMRFLTNATEAMRITSSGNVGIGTTSPGGILHAVATLPRIIADTSSQYAVLNLYASGSEKGALYLDNTAKTIILEANGDNTYPLLFRTGGSERMRITSAGNVLIGTTTDYSSKVIAYGIDATATNYCYRAVNSNGIGIFAVRNDSWTIIDGRVDFKGSWGRDSVNDKFSMGFETTTGGWLQTWGGKTLRLNESGNNVYAYGNNGFGLVNTTSSDARIKKNISLITDGLSKVMALNGVYYEFDENNELGIMVPFDKQRIGLIAQEVEAIIPEAVINDKDINMPKSIDYGGMVGVLVKAIQELKAELDALKA